MTPIARTTTMGRPPGEIRQVLLDTLRAKGPMALRDLAAATQVGYQPALKTLRRCLKSGVLIEAGQEKREHSKRWVKLYDLAPEPTPGDDSRHGHGWVDLGRCIAGWAR